MGYRFDEALVSQIGAWCFELFQLFDVPPRRNERCWTGSPRNLRLYFSPHQGKETVGLRTNPKIFLKQPELRSIIWFSDRHRLPALEFKLVVYGDTIWNIVLLAL